jgi:hypothetical protein
MEILLKQIEDFLKILHEEQYITNEDISLSLCWYKLIKYYNIIKKWNY